MPALLTIFTLGWLACSSGESSAAIKGQVDLTPSDRPKAHSPITTCDALLIRRHETCPAESQAAIDAMPRGLPRRPMSTYTQYERCVFFPDRRTDIAACLDLQDCVDWAACDAQLLVDEWRVSTSASICDAVTLRRSGSAKDELLALAPSFSGGMKSQTLHLAHLALACPEEPELQQALAGCLLLSDQAFAGCVLAAQTP